MHIWFVLELLFKNSSKNQAHNVSFCNWLRSKFIMLTLFSSKKKFSHLVFCDWGTCTSVGGASSSTVNNCPASQRHGLGQVVNHLCWDGHRFLLECLKQLTYICRGIHSALNVFLQLVPSVFVWVDVWGCQRPVLLARNCVVWHAAWGLVLSWEVQCHTTFDTWNKTAKKYTFLFLNSI